MSKGIKILLTLLFTLLLFFFMQSCKKEEESESTTFMTEPSITYTQVDETTQITEPSSYLDLDKDTRNQAPSNWTGSSATNFVPSP